MKDFTEIASVSGKGGLFKILRPGRAGVILESLDQKRIKLVTNPTHKVSVLSDISIYTNTEEGAIPLEDVLKKIFKEFGDDPGIDSKSTPDELLSFIEYIVPEYDTERVYPSDIKKLISWYHIILKEDPSLLKDGKESSEKTVTAEKKDDKSADSKAADQKPTPKKKTAAKTKKNQN